MGKVLRPSWLLAGPSGFLPGNEDENVHARRRPGPEEEDLPSGSWLTSTARIDRVRAGFPAYRLPRLRQEEVKGDSETPVETLLFGKLIFSLYLLFIRNDCSG